VKGWKEKICYKKNAAIFKEQGAALDHYAKKTVKVLVVGNPANTNAYLAMTNAPSIPKENFSALTRLDHNRAKAQIAARLNLPVGNVHNVVIWGNHSSTQYPDVSNGFVILSDGSKVSVKDAIKDDAWLHGDFITTVQQRGAAIIKACNLSSSASAAKAIIDHMRDWVFGTHEDEVVSMAVRSDGSYGIPQDLIYSFPVRCRDGSYSIVQGFTINDFSRSKMELTAAELNEERGLIS